MGYIPTSFNEIIFFLFWFAVRKVKCVGTVDRKFSWDCAHQFLSWCEKQCNIKRDTLTTDFCTFLGKSTCDLAKLRKYPHNWDDSMKGDYLMSLVASDHGRMRCLLRDSGLDWPYLKLPRIFNNLPKLLQEILDWDASNGRLHNTFDFFSYVILVRNLYKHYKDFQVTDLISPLSRCIIVFARIILVLIHLVPVLFYFLDIVGLLDRIGSLAAVLFTWTSSSGRGRRGQFCFYY